MLCPKCGNEVHEGDVICLECGTLLTNTYVPIKSDSNNEESGSSGNQKVNVVESQNVQVENPASNMSNIQMDNSMREQTTSSNATIQHSNVQPEDSMNYSSNMERHDYNQAPSIQMDSFENQIPTVQEESVSNQSVNMNNAINQTPNIIVENQMDQLPSMQDTMVNSSFDTMNNQIPNIMEDSTSEQSISMNNTIDQASNMVVENQVDQLPSMQDAIVNSSFDTMNNQIPNIMEDSTSEQSISMNNTIDQTPNMIVENQANQSLAMQDTMINSNYGMIDNQDYVNQYQNYNNIEPTFDNNKQELEPSYTDNSDYTSNDSNYLNSDKIEDVPKFDFVESNQSNDNIFNDFEMNSTVTPEQIAANIMNNNEVSVNNDINQNINQDVTVDNYTVNNSAQNISTMDATNYSASNDYSINNINQAVDQTDLQENIIPVVPAVDNNVVPSVIPQVDQKSENNNQPEEIKNEKVKPIKKKRNKTKTQPNKKGLLIIIGVVVAILLIAMVCYYYFSKKAPSQYILNDDKIPSITSIVGSRNLDSSSNSNENEVVVKKYHYTKIKNVMSDLYQYINYLTGSLNYINTTAYDLNEETGTVQLGNDSKTSGYVVIVNIEYGPDEYTVTVRKAPGTLTRY